MMNFDETQESILLVVLEKENLARMSKADPVTLESMTKGGVLPAPRYSRVSILIAYEEEDVELYRRVREGNGVELLRWLERGRTWDESQDGKKNSFIARKGMPLR